MKIYLVVSKECNLNIDGEVKTAGVPFEINEEKYESLKGMLELIGTKEEETTKKKIK